MGLPLNRLCYRFHRSISALPPAPILPEQLSAWVLLQRVH